MKEKIKNVIGIIITIAIIVFAILWYPWKTIYEDDEPRCYNLLGYEGKCR